MTRTATAIKQTEEQRAFEHFIRLATKGGHPAASSGEKRCRRLAQCVIDNVGGLDGRAIAGFGQFIIKAAFDAPEEARDIVEGMPGEVQP